MEPMGGREGRVVCEADNLNKKNPYVWWKQPQNEKNSIHLQFFNYYINREREYLYEKSIPSVVNV